METIRLILIFLHTLITIFAAINLHPHLSLAANAEDHHKQISAIIRYITDLLCISLYHTASIAAVWFSRRYGAGLVRATGVLLIGELLQIITSVIQHALDTQSARNNDLFFSITQDLILLIAIILTFRLAEQISKHQKDLMQIELLADNINNIAMNDCNEPTFI